MRRTRSVALACTAVFVTFMTSCGGPSQEPTTTTGNNPGGRPGAVDPGLGAGGGDAWKKNTGTRIRVNQVGYLPQGPKGATVVTRSNEPLSWQLRDGAGRVVADGRSTPRGTDQASGQNVQTVDFTRYDKPGRGYTLRMDDQTSLPFDISAQDYSKLRTSALRFFYYQRSGTPILASLVGKKYARPAGHVGVGANGNDADVPCQPGVCNYRQDVHGGWYDAADHGKYVVNGGLAVSQLFGTWERAKHSRNGNPKALGDGTLSIPENNNGVPDVLDEARWEMEFLLRMQVPAGRPLAGMAFHKIHDKAWTGLPMAPQDDPQPRELHRPSTAATLNLAAAGAQCARVFAPYDKAFANRCLGAAKTAWAAAKRHPKLYAPDSDSTGGGAYGDTNVTDEFYWAAAELALTTGERPYLAALRASPLHRSQVFTPAGFGWQSVGPVARLDLATVPGKVPASERRAAQASVIRAANSYLATQRGQAYGLPLPGGPEYYGWGSNSNVLNNLAVLSTAYDISGKDSYRNGALEGMDYLLGRNALNQSYVTGYGKKVSHNLHSRSFAHELDKRLPPPPPGFLAGGPNAALQDPVAQKQRVGCKPQLCYIDDIQSYATNEYAINWNSTLAWMSSFAADQGTTGAGRGRV